MVPRPQFLPLQKLRHRSAKHWRIRTRQHRRRRGPGALAAMPTPKPARRAIMLLLMRSSFLSVGASAAASRPVANTPVLGWNSWATFGCGVNETILINAADQMHALGLDAAGYVYVNTDDCWMSAARDTNTKAQIPAPSKFPGGFKNMIDHIHALGMRFGLYTAIGMETCSKYAASCGHEAIDAQQYADWVRHT